MSMNYLWKRHLEQKIFLGLLFAKANEREVSERYFFPEWGYLGSWGVFSTEEKQNHSDELMLVFFFLFQVREPTKHSSFEEDKKKVGCISLWRATIEGELTPSRD